MEVHLDIESYNEAPKDIDKPSFQENCFANRRQESMNNEKNDDGSVSYSNIEQKFEQTKADLQQKNQDSNELAIDLMNKEAYDSAGSPKIVKTAKINNENVIEVSEIHIEATSSCSDSSNIGINAKLVVVLDDSPAERGSPLEHVIQDHPRSASDEVSSDINIEIEKPARTIHVKESKPVILSVTPDRLNTVQDTCLDPTKFVCQICFELKLHSQAAVYEHSVHHLCEECFAEYLRWEIARNHVKGLKCPHCFVILTELTVKTYTSKETYDKYLRFMKTGEVAANPLLRWCPNEHCVEIISLENLQSAKAKCGFCKLEICTKCNLKYHESQSCDINLEKELQDWKRDKEVQRCPICKILIEKIDGCNHMTCEICQYEWCWICGGEYSENHYSYLNPLGCPGFKSNPNIRKLGFIIMLLWRILVLISLIAFLPFAIVFYFPWIFTRNLYREHIRYAIRSRCLRVPYIVFVFLIGLVLDPFVLAFTAIAVIPVGICYLVEYLRAREARKRRAQIALIMRRINSNKNDGRGNAAKHGHMDFLMHAQRAQNRRTHRRRETL